MKEKQEKTKTANNKTTRQQNSDESVSGRRKCMGAMGTNADGQQETDIRNCKTEKMDRPLKRPVCFTVLLLAVLFFSSLPL